MITKRHTENIHINKIRNENGVIKTESEEFQESLGHYSKIVLHKIGKSERKRQFSLHKSLTNLNQDQISDLYRPITLKEIERAFKNLPTKTCPGPDGFSTELYQILKG